MEESGCGFLIKQIDSALNKRANANLRDVGVTLSQVAVLRTIYLQPGRQAEFKQVERSLKVSQPTTVGIISRLRDKGLLETFCSPDNPNAKVARLTRQGEEVCEKAGESVVLEEEAMLAGFDDEERDQLMSMLERVSENLGG